MKTLPTQWRLGKTSRDFWYNNRGTPIILVRIQRLGGGYIRLSNAEITYKEENGIKYNYSADYFTGISEIGMSLDLLGGYPGATGQLGQCTISINDGELDGLRFTEIYELDQFINATVDVFLTFNEVTLEDANSIQIYKGVITNYLRDGIFITLSVNDFSTTKHKNIPSRVDEFKEKHSSGWTVPDNNVGKVIPICFGTGMYRAYLVDIVEGTPRYYHVAYHYKDTRITPKASLFYYDPQLRRFIDVPVLWYEEVSYLSGDLYLIRFDINDFAEIAAEMHHYISCHKVDVSYSDTGYPKVIYEAKLYDRKKIDTTYAASNNEWMFSSSYSGAFGAWFHKNLFEDKGNFDLYVHFEASYPTGAEGNPNEWTGQFHSGWFDLEPEFLVKDEWDAVNSHAYNSFIPLEYLPEGYAPSSEPLLLQKNMKMSDIITNFPYCSLRLKKLAGNHTL